MSFLIGKVTVQRFINRVSRAILKHLAAEYMPVPRTPADWEQISQTFEGKRKFPHILGAIDGKHCRIMKPSKSGLEFYNYKNFYSIVLLAVCDADYKFIYCQCGSKGSESDGGIFGDSKLLKWLEESSLNIPEPKDILGFGKIPYFFVADGAFKGSQHVLKPYSGIFLSEDQLNFNKRLSAARCTIEQTFGILTSKFRFLLNGIHAEPSNIEVQVLSACVVHNIIRFFKSLNDIPVEGMSFLELVEDSPMADNYKDVLKDILSFD